MTAHELTDDPAVAPGPASDTTSRRSTPGLPIECRLLRADDLDELRRVHREIVEAAPPGTVARESDAFLAGHIDTRGHTIGLFFEGRLIGYAILGLAGEEHARLAHLLALPPAMVDRFAVLDGVGVAREFRRRGLHQAVNRRRAAIAAQHGRDLIGATAAPGNPTSWHNLMRFGLEIRGLALMFDGYWRYLMLRAGPPAAAAPVTAVPVTYVDALDVRAQQRLLAQGYRGIRASRRGEHAEVGYVAGGGRHRGTRAAP